MTSLFMVRYIITNGTCDGKIYTAEEAAQSLYLWHTWDDTGVLVLWIGRHVQPPQKCIHPEGYPGSPQLYIAGRTTS